MAKAKDYFKYGILNGAYKFQAGFDTLKEARTAAKKFFTDNDYHIVRFDETDGHILRYLKP